MKIIKLTIVLAMIFGSLALDMSSTKRRTTTSAYVALYTSLGFEYGYKAYGSFSPNVIFQYYISFETSPGTFKAVGQDTPLRSSKFFMNNALILSMTNAVKVNLPAWLQSYCKTDNQCSFAASNLTSFTQLENGDSYFLVGIKGDDKKTHKIQINFTNVSKDFARDTIPTFKLSAITGEYANLNSGLRQAFNDVTQSAANHILKIRTNLEQLIESSVYSLNTQLKDLKTQIEEFITKKETLTKELTNIQSQITTNAKDIQKKKDLKSLCLEELQNIIIEISAEEKIIKSKKEEKELKIAENKVKKEGAEKVLFYWLEASYFYRVFGEKLVKSEKDVPAVLLPENFTVFSNKIKSAFYPRQFLFADANKK